jgi:hypothetical protein
MDDHAADRIDHVFLRKEIASAIKTIGMKGPPLDDE